MDELLKKQLMKTACKVRMGIIEGVYNAKSGHPGGSLSAVELMVGAFYTQMRVDPQNPHDPNRDRFILS